VTVAVEAMMAQQHQSQYFNLLNISYRRCDFRTASYIL